MKHGNISIFIPHVGCPCRCSFCDQGHITGQYAAPTPATVRAQLHLAAQQLGTRAQNTQVAFFGGSFTAIDRGYMEALLEVGQAACKAWGMLGIRVSTRPDAIDSEILDLLQHYGVTDIELGAQSLDNAVLAKNNRGHTAEQVCTATAQIQAAGFSVGLQMMTGLLGATAETDLQTAVKITELSPNTVRIYPTVVLENTELCNLYREGQYVPQRLEEAVHQCAKLLQLFHENNISVIRVGLHASEEIAARRVAGPYHPAFRELCQSRLFFLRLLPVLHKTGCAQATVRVNPRQMSVAVGQKCENVHKLKALGFTIEFTADAAVEDFVICERNITYAP